MGWKDAPKADQDKSKWKNAPATQGAAATGKAETEPKPGNAVVSAAAGDNTPPKYGTKEWREWFLQGLERSGYSRENFEKAPPKPPGPEKDLVTAVGDWFTANRAGQEQGMTLGFSDEIFAGAMAPLHAIGPVLEGKPYDLGWAYNDNLEWKRKQIAEDRAKDEGAAKIGDVLGSAITLGGLSKTPLGGKLLGATGTVPSRIVMGGASGGAIAGVDTLGRGGSWDQAVNNAKLGALIGLGLPIAGAAAKSGIAAATGTAFDPAEKALARALDADGIPVDQVNARLAAKGPDAVLADLGPNLQRQAGALASLPGKAQSLVRGALAARAAGTNARIRGDVDATLGPAPTPSSVTAEINAGKKVLSPMYEQTLDQSAAGDMSRVAESIEGMISEAKGPAQRKLAEVRNMLDYTAPDAPGLPKSPTILDPNPRGWLKARQAIDGMLDGEKNGDIIRQLTEARRQIDEMLATHVPGIKSLDDQYRELARQEEALTTGQQLLDSGRTATRPVELETMMQEGALPQGQMVGPSAVPFRLAQGTRAEIERIIGTTANDLNALKTALKGDGSWNRDRLVTLYGKDKADRLLDILEREKDFDATNRIVTQNSETAARKTAQAEFDGGMPQATRDITIPGLIAMGAQKIANVGARTRRAGTNSAVAGALMSRQLDPKMVSAVQRVLLERQKPALFAPALGGLAAIGLGG